MEIPVRDRGPMDRDGETAHAPVMLEEMVVALAVDRDGFYVDATFGRGGHARRLLAELSPRGRLLAIDRDADAHDSACRLAKADARVQAGTADSALSRTISVVATMADRASCPASCSTWACLRPS